MEDSKGGRFHSWTPHEDKMLVQCLVELRTEQKFMADNGFKAGYANCLEAMLAERLPNSGIKATPHILSRIKTMKTAWQTVYDMVYGNNTSGFGWDPDKKVVTADDQVWEEYIKAHKKAAACRHKPLPHFESLTFVWSKDRAVGDQSCPPGGMEEEIEEEGQEIPESPVPNSAVPIVDLSQPGDATHGVVHTDGVAHTDGVPHTEGSCAGRKRRRTCDPDSLNDVFRDAVASINTTMVQALDNLGSRLSNHGRQGHLDEVRSNIFIDLMEIEGLTSDQLSAAHLKLVVNEDLLLAFSKVPGQFKRTWVLQLLKQ